MDKSQSGGKLLPVASFKHFKIADAGPDARFSVLIVFPRQPVKWDRYHYQNWMTDKEMMMLFEHGLLHAFHRALSDDILTHVPFNIRAQKEKKPGANDVVALSLNNQDAHRVLKELRTIVNENPMLSDFRDFQFHVYGKGLKTLTKRDTSISMRDLLEAYIHPKEHSSMYIDVAVEFMSKESGQSLFWPKDCVLSFIRAVTTATSNGEITDVCLSESLSGCRLRMDSHEARNRCIFFQMYTVDKTASSPVSRPMHDIEPSLEDVAANSLKMTKFIQFMSLSLETTDSQNLSYPARVEYRVKGLALAQSCLSVAYDRPIPDLYFYKVRTRSLLSYRYVLLHGINSLIQCTRVFILGVDSRKTFLAGLWKLLLGVSRSLLYSARVYKYEAVNRYLRKSITDYNFPYLLKEYFNLEYFRMTEELDSLPNTLHKNLCDLKYGSLLPEKKVRERPKTVMAFYNHLRDFSRLGLGTKMY
jgi:hypothetical protein